MIFSSLCDLVLSFCFSNLPAVTDCKSRYRLGVDVDNSISSGSEQYYYIRIDLFLRPYILFKNVWFGVVKLKKKNYGFTRTFF